MKKGLLFLLTALLLATFLTACAQIQPYNGRYSNVSTTRNGYVNGTNSYVNGATGYENSYYNGANGYVNGYQGGTATRYQADYDVRQTRPYASDAAVR